MIQEPSENIRKQIYQFYCKIYDSSFDIQKKKNLLTSIAGWEKWSWRVVGITANAVGRIIDEDGHARVKSELVRDHFFQGRSKTYENMLKKKLDYENYWKEFWENDSYDLSGGPSIFSGTSTANTGGQAAKFTSGGNYAYQEVHVEPNACYTVQYHIRSNTGGVVQLDILADGNLIDPTAGTALATGLHTGSTGGAYEVQTLTFTVTNTIR